ncbi:hypothetical protein MKW92_045633 [Papaver armeniacum]|nr:hypothetical protein MKW92_045633 [Papaver armeniacum]
MADNHQDLRAKKVRGKGKLGFLNELKDGDKVQVELYRGCPTGETRKHLGHYIGFLAKDGHMLPLSVSNWKYMATARIQAAMQEIKHIFEYPEVLDEKIIEKLNLSWKAHKSNMKKKGFDVNRTREENLAHRPEGVVESQWAPLVEMWESEQNQALAATKEDFEMATKRVSELETQFSTLIKLMMVREQLQPNPNNEGLDQGFLDLMEWN